MASLTSTDFITKFKNMTHREKMIATGLITGDEPSKDDQEFNIALTLVGKNAWRLVDRVLLDFKSKRTDKYHKLYRDQLGVILANLYETYNHLSKTIDKEIDNKKFEENTEIVKLSKGTLICFPSHLWHRVKPVTKGERYSLVMWFGGPSFK